MNEWDDMKPQSTGMAEPSRTHGKQSEVMWQRGGLPETPSGGQTRVGSCRQKMRRFFLSKYEVSEIAQADANGHSCSAKDGGRAGHRTRSCPPRFSQLWPQLRAGRGCCPEPRPPEWAQDCHRGPKALEGCSWGVCLEEPALPGLPGWESVPSMELASKRN